MSVRGYADWNPKPESLDVVRRVDSILKEYEDYLPMTLRQIFYRLVADHGFEKTERAYNRLGDYVARARRAQLLPFDSIADDQGRPHAVLDYSGPAGFWSETRRRSRSYRRKRLNGQGARIEVWAEAAWQTLTPVAWEYGIPVFSSRGFASVTNCHAVAERALDFDGPTILLHLGDHDPSGVSIFESLWKDATSFLLQDRIWKAQDVDDQQDFEYVRNQVGAPAREWDGPMIVPVRVALTEAQIVDFEVETSPPKKKDSRSRSWIGETAQLEALAPDQLSGILRSAIEGEIDLDRYEEEVAREEDDQTEIGAVLAAAEEGENR